MLGRDGFAKTWGSLLVVSVAVVTACHRDTTAKGQESATTSPTPGVAKRSESAPSPRDGPHTADARRQLQVLSASTDPKVVLEAESLLFRYGRDSVPALMESLRDGNEQAKQRAASLLGKLGVAAENAVPLLREIKLGGSYESSMLASSALVAIDQWKACGFPGLPADLEVHVIGVYKGTKELDVQLGQHGHAVTEIEVIVDRTSRPLGLVLTAYDPVAWNVGLTPGANVAAVLVSGYEPQALLGLPRSVPHRVLSQGTSVGCKVFSGTGPEREREIEPTVVALMGQPITEFHGSSPVPYFQIGGDPASRPANVRFASDFSLEEYGAVRTGLPPGDKGIDQLVRDGKLRRATAADVEAWNGDEKRREWLKSEFAHGSLLVVLEKISLPPGLFGAQRRTFIIPAGVPKPEGPKGHCNFYYLKDGTSE